MKKNKKKFTKKTEKIQDASFLFVTRNRCPNQDFNKNPLTWSFETLLANKLSYKITEWIVMIDGSNDFTKQNIKWLEKKHNITIKTNYYKNRKGCSYRRSQGIKKLSNDLFFMGDDDCLYSKNFIKNSLKFWQKIKKKDPLLAVIAQPILEMRTSFYGKIDKSKIGKIDFKKAWFYHNFDKKPYHHKKEIKNPFKIYIFKGVTLGSKKAFIKAGNFPDLSFWENDYSEHLKMSYQLDKSGYTMYYLPDINASTTHIQWGSNKKILPKSEKNIIFQGINIKLADIEKASRGATKSGCRVTPKKFLINRIGSFLSFYMEVNPKIAQTYAILEYNSIITNRQIIGTPTEINKMNNKQRVVLWKKGIKKGIKYVKNDIGFSKNEWYNKLIKQIGLK